MHQKKQQGITLIGLVFAAASLVVLVILTMKVVPVYINRYAIIKSIKDLRQLPKEEIRGNPQAAIAYLKEFLSRKLYINEIRFITKKDMIIKRKRKFYIVSVPYTVEKKLLSNVFLVFKFNPSYEVSIEGD